MLNTPRIHWVCKLNVSVFLCLCLCFSNQYLPNNFNKNHFKTIQFVILLHFINFKTPKKKKKKKNSHENLFLNVGFSTALSGVGYLECYRNNCHATEIKGLINTALLLAEILQCCGKFWSAAENMPETETQTEKHWVTHFASIYPWNLTTDSSRIPMCTCILYPSFT